MTNSSTAGIGLRIDQEETFIAMAALLRPRDFGRRGRRLDDAHRVAVGQEAAARRDHARVGIEAADDLDAVADAPADRRP